MADPGKETEEPGKSLPPSQAETLLPPCRPEDRPEGRGEDDPCCQAFDDILTHVGEFGRYQRWVYFFLFLPTIFSAMQKLAWVFLGATVDHRCRLPGESVDALFQDAPKAEDRCSYVGPGGNVTSCDRGWVYDRSVFGSSAVMDWDLVCDSKALRATAQALFMLGVFVGSFVFGYLSDRFGRKPVFMLSVLLQFLFGLASGVAPEYWTFAVARMFVGMTTSGVFLVSYVLAMEMVGPRFRVLAGTLCQYYYTFGFLLMALVAYFLNSDWQTLEIVLTAPMVLFLSYWWLMPESVRWLIRKRRYVVYERNIFQAFPHI